MAEKIEKNRILWFDYLRPILTFFVILTHSWGFCSENDKWWMHFFPEFIFTCAVPCFLIISSILVVPRCVNINQWKERVIQVLSLYVFWTVLWMLKTGARPENDFWSSVEFALRGGGWAYYFFAVLLLLTVMAYPIRVIHPEISFKIGVSLWIALGVYFVYGIKQNTWTGMETYWWPVNFLAIPFIAPKIRTLLYEKKEIGKRWLFYFGLAYVGSCVVEALAISSASEVCIMPAYTRVSPICGALFLIFLNTVLELPHRKVVRFISDNSLGVFTLHCFVLGESYKILNKMQLPGGCFFAIVLNATILIIVLSIVSHIIRGILSRKLI